MPFKQGLDKTAHEHNWTSIEEFLNSLEFSDAGPIGGGDHITGNGPPSSADGRDGDVWFDNTNAIIYYKDPGGWILAFDALNQADFDVLVGLIEGKVEWRNTWSQIAYQENDMVRDGSWLMIANKDTFDRAAPQPIGGTSWIVPDAPVWTINEETNYVQSGFRVRVPAGRAYAVEGIRVWVQDLSPETVYRPYAYDNVTGRLDIGQQFTGDIAAVPGWIQLVSSAILLPGDDITMWVRQERFSSTTKYNHAWSRAPNTQANTDPGIGNWSIDNQLVQVRINTTDADGQPRDSELDIVVPNSILRMVDENNINAYMEFQVQAVTNNTTFYVYDVTLLDTGTAGEPPVGNRDQIYFDIPVPVPTKFVTLPSYFAPYPALSGLIKIGEDPSVENNDAHGIDLLLQEYVASPDWDLASTSGIGGAGSGGSEPTEQLLQLEAWPSVLTFGGSMTTSGTEVTVAAGRGVIMDAYTNPEAAPSVTTIEWDETILDLGNVTTRPFTYILVNNLGIVEGLFGGAGPELLRTHIYLGVVSHHVVTGLLGEPRHAGPIPSGSAELFMDFLYAIKSPFLSEGGEIDPNTDMTFATADQVWFAPGAAWHTDKDNPNFVVNPSQDPTEFVYMRYDGTPWPTNPTTIVDGDFYEDITYVDGVPTSSVLVDITGSPNRASIQRFFTTVSGQSFMMYGQEVYDSLQGAVDNIYHDTQNFVLPPYFQAGDSSFIAMILLEHSATNLALGEDVIIINDTRLPVGGGGSAAHAHDGLYLSLLGGTMAGSINMATNTLINVPDPINPQDPVTKAYLEVQKFGGDHLIQEVDPGAQDVGTVWVDPSSMGSTSIFYLPLLGGTMKGDIDMDGYQILNFSFAADFLPLAGGTMLGNIDMGGFQLTNVVAGTEDDAVPRSFIVDGFLPLAGGIMTGPLDMGGNNILNVGGVGSYLPIAGGTMAGAIDMNDHQILNADIPELANYLALAGGIMVGNLDLNGQIFYGMADVNMQTGDDMVMRDSDGVARMVVRNSVGQVGALGGDFDIRNGSGSVVWQWDDSLSKFVSYGDHDLNGSKITELGYPSASTDAASKQYVDDQSGGSVATWYALNLQSGWQDYGPNWAIARYRVDADGLIHVQGMIRYGTTTPGTLVATLPSGFQPRYDMIINIRASTGSARVNVRGWSGGTPGQIQTEAGWSSSWTAINFTLAKD